MKKRTFIKLSSAAVAASILSPRMAWAQKEKLKNWAGNIQYSTGNVAYPDSVEKIKELVRAHDKIKALGTRHCFNTIADSSHQLLSLKNHNQHMVLDAANQQVTVDSGVTYGQLGPWLHAKGYALKNLASLPHISVAGSCSTGTHGSGVGNKNLSSAVKALEFVSADGSLQSLSRVEDADKFAGTVVSLGAIGVITQVTLEVEPTYQVEQQVFENMPVETLRAHFDEILSGGYSVSLFTDWQTPFVNEVWVKSKVGASGTIDKKNEWFGAKAATRNVHPIIALSAENCTEQMGVPGPWFERLPHFKMGFTPSSGVELQAEYFVPYEHGADAFFAIAAIGKTVGPQLMISEIRTIAADDLWMSPCFEQPCMTIHFTLKQHIPEVNKLLPVIEKALEPFEPKPHWGKLFTLSPATLHSRYKKMDEFLAMAREYDPKGKFRNSFLDKNLGG